MADALRLSNILRVWLKIYANYFFFNQGNGASGSNQQQQNSSDSPVRLLRLRLIAGHNLAKKDIFGASDPYVRIDLIRQDNNNVIDSAYTKTKKRVCDKFWQVKSYWMSFVVLDIVKVCESFICDLIHLLWFIIQISWFWPFRRRFSEHMVWQAKESKLTCWEHSLLFSSLFLFLALTVFLSISTTRKLFQKSSYHSELVSLTFRQWHPM